MRILIQRVSRAAVRVDGVTVGQIGSGIVALLGFRIGDGEPEIMSLAAKLIQLRIFPDSEGKMNRSIVDIGGEVLVVSQFTLYGDARKGNRPNFLAAERPERAQALYERFVEVLKESVGTDRVSLGVFQAMMEVELVNDGPVTILLEGEAGSVAEHTRS